MMFSLVGMLGIGLFVLLIIVVTLLIVRNR